MSAGNSVAAGPWWKRIGWFVLLWVAGVAVVGAVAWLLRLWIKP